MTSVGWVVHQVPVNGNKVLNQVHFNGEHTNILDVKDGTIEIKLAFCETPLNIEYTKLCDVFHRVDNDDEKIITWVRVDAPRLGQGLPA